MSQSGWRLAYKPRKWQELAIRKWQEQRKGIVEVVTGGGKTVFAFLCMLKQIEENPDTQFLIVVPSLSLLDQWVIALQDELGVDAQEIGQLGGGERPQNDAKIVVAVINSARTFSAQFAARHPSFLIVDECHKAGSAKNREALQGEFTATLGLSATPEREYDDGFQEVIKPALGEIVFSYTYEDASHDDVIAPFDLINVKIPMLEDETVEYQKANQRIARLIATGHDDEKLKRALIHRASIINSLRYRVPSSIRILEDHSRQRSIIFHEQVPAAKEIYDLLLKRGHNVTIYHSKISPPVRRENLRMFRKGYYDALVCCRALDEGMNVPETTVAIIASSTASKRQRIQRLGRVLRPAEGKTHATVYTLFATDHEQERLLLEAEALKNVGNVSWRQLTSASNESSIPL